MSKVKTSVIFCLIHALLLVSVISMPLMSADPSRYQDILDPKVLKPYMFTTQITGQLEFLTPTQQKTDDKGCIIRQDFYIQMVKTKQQILPKKLWNQTTIYAYAGQTKSGFIASFPGPSILAKKNLPIKVVYKNKIPGPHILPVDYVYPFIDDQAFRKFVPAVPHAHGIATATVSDGQPQAYWTINGLMSHQHMDMDMDNRVSINQFKFYYPNQQEAGNNWYHDHAMGITRLNVYAGLAGFYKIVDYQNAHEQFLIDKYGYQVNQNQTKYLIVTDKTFKKNGELFYPTQSQNPNFDSWNPQFFGNTILVNGVLWPKMTLKKGKHRFVLLNACQSRFLNFYFQSNKEIIPFDLIRIDSDFYNSPVTVKQFLTSLSSRIQFIIDLTKIQGEVLLKNKAPAPFPSGQPQNLQPDFTGQIMKIKIIKDKNLVVVDQNSFSGEMKKENCQVLSNQPYPFFKQGQRYYTTLFQLENSEGFIQSVFIDGLSMQTSMNCKNSTFKVGKTYDFYIINLTEDMHPIHFHLINMQKIKQFPIDSEAYKKKYFKVNGGKPDKYGFLKPPITMDPSPYRSGPDEYPKDYQKVFRDTIEVNPGYVTVFRIKFAKNNGSDFKSFNAQGQRYVYHCHILDHEDNQMMKYYCLE